LQRFAELIETKKIFDYRKYKKDLKLQKGKSRKPLSRLKLDEAKFRILTQGILDIANFDEPSGRLMEQLNLTMASF